MTSHPRLRVQSACTEKIVCNARSPRTSCAGSANRNRVARLSAAGEKHFPRRTRHNTERDRAVGNSRGDGDTMTRFNFYNAIRAEIVEGSDEKETREKNEKNRGVCTIVYCTTRV